MQNNNDRGRGDEGLVYSTQHGRMCSRCARPVRKCICPTVASVPVGDGVVRVSRETQGRKGKGVTVITGIPLAGSDLTDLAKALKQRCGSGGTAKDGRIEIQGEHRTVVAAELEKRGWRVKLAGG